MDQFYTGPMSALLNGSVSQYELYEQINAEREAHDGNYDAIYGKITKFNLQFNPDGSYDCQVELTSVGDVVESLKVNITDPNKDTTSEGEEEDEENEQPPLIANKDKSILTIIKQLFNQLYEDDKNWFKTRKKLYDLLNGNKLHRECTGEINDAIEKYDKLCSQNNRQKYTKN